MSNPAEKNIKHFANRSSSDNSLYARLPYTDSSTITKPFSVIRFSFLFFKLVLFLWASRSS